MKRYAIVAVVCALAIPVALAEGAGGTTEGSCPPGSHFKVTVTSPNGEVSTLEIQRDLRDLPPGAYVTADGGGSQIRVNQDGAVQASGGKVDILCIRPTH